MSRFRQILLMALLFGGLNFATAQPTQDTGQLNQELVSARIQALRDSGSQEGTETTIGSYEAVFNWLGEAGIHAVAEKAYLQAQIEAPKQDAEIRDRMESSDYRSPDINPAEVAKLSTKQLEEKLAELRLKQRETENAKNQLDEKILSEQSSAPSIQTRLDEIDKRLKELPTTPVTIERDLQPSQFEATQWSILAERKALNAERRSLQAQLTSQPARFSRRQAESNELALILNGVSKDIEALEVEQASRARLQELTSSTGIDENMPGYGFIQQLLDNNTKLREQSTELDNTLSALKEANTRIEQELLSLNDSFDGVITLVSLAGKSASLGHELMVHWRQMDSYSPANVDMISAERFGEHVIQRKQYEDALNALPDARESLAGELSAETGSPETEPDEKLVEAAKSLIRSKRELLTGLIASENELINERGKLERNHGLLNERLNEYRAYLGSRILWVPSHPPLTFAVFKNIRQELGDLQSIFTRLNFSRLALESWLLVVLALGLFISRKKIDSRLDDINQRIGRVRSDSIFHTIQALLLNILRVMPVPFLLLLVAQGLKGPDTDAAPYLVNGLLDAIEILFLLLILRTSCLDNGIARTHFAWSKEYCGSLQRLSTRLIYWWFPFLVLTAFMFKAELGSTNLIIGRLIFSVSMIIFTGLLLRHLFSESATFQDHRRTRFWLAVLVVINGGFFIATAMMGYLYSGEIVFQVVTHSLIIIVASVFLYYIMQRWLLVVRRRLRFSEMLAARQAPKENDALEVEHEAVDLVKLSESVSSLLKVVTITIAAFGLIYIWAPLFRALEVLQQVTLWTISDVSDGEAILTTITLASLGLSLMIGLFTFLAARYVPPLLALMLRSRKTISPGSRYAVTKLLGYLIITVGVLAFLSTLGLRWDRLQWLVAALGVGIGFGLQGIIANVICGLIILFERPIRVGDVITVGESSGHVVRIRVRATTIRDFDGKELVVPNMEFITGRLLNWTLSDTNVRMSLDVGIAYGSDVRKAIAILQDVVDQHELIASEPKPDVIFNRFGDNALNLTVRYFLTDVSKRGLLLSDLHMRINDAFAESGIVIAFPQIDVHFDGQGGAAPVSQAATPATETT